MKKSKQKDLSQLDQDSQEYWEEVLKREGLSMSRGMYPQRVSYGWQYHDRDKRNDTDKPNGTPNTPSNTVPQAVGSVTPVKTGPGPQSKQIDDNYGVAEDNYTEDSKP